MECIFAPVLGLVVQLVRIPACHAGGRGFESRPDRRIKSAQSSGFFYAPILKVPVYFEYVKTNLHFAWAFTVGLCFPK